MEGEKKGKCGTHRVMAGLFLELAGSLPMLGHCQSHERRKVSIESLLLSPCARMNRSAGKASKSIQVRWGVAEREAAVDHETTAPWSLIDFRIPLESARENQVFIRPRSVRSRRDRLGW